MGQLTRLGMSQQFNLGRQLRYNFCPQLLSDVYKHSEIHVRSTDVDPTLMSAQAHLAGLYYPVVPRLFRQLAWTPIPVHTTDRQHDPLLFVDNCPRLETEMALGKTSPAAQQFVKHDEWFFGFLTRVAGEPINEHNSDRVLDPLACDADNKLTPPPEWLTAEVQRNITVLRDFVWATRFPTPLARRIRDGLLLWTMLHNINLKVAAALTTVSNGASLGSAATTASSSSRFPLRMQVYSGHDNNVAALLDLLGVFDGRQPPVASAVLLELHTARRLEAEERWLIRLRYRNSSDAPTAHTLKLKQCSDARSDGLLDDDGGFCPLEVFQNLTKPLVLKPADYDSECSRVD